MSKCKFIAVMMFVLTLLIGCSTGGRDVTKIYPVNDFIVINDGCVATFEVKGSLTDYEFKDRYIYQCEESSRVIGVGTEYNDGGLSLTLYLYLSPKDYEAYINDKFDVNMTIVESSSYCVKCGAYIDDISGFLESGELVVCDECLEKGNQVISHTNTDS